MAMFGYYVYLSQVVEGYPQSEVDQPVNCLVLVQNLSPSSYFCYPDLCMSYCTDRSLVLLEWSQR